MSKSTSQEGSGNVSGCKPGQVIDADEITRVLEEIKAAFISKDNLEAYRLLKCNENEIEKVCGCLPFWLTNIIAEVYRCRFDFVCAERWYKRAATFNPDDFLFWLNMASFYLITGRFEKSFEIYKEKLDEVDNKLEYLQVYLFMLHYNPYVSREELFELHKEWGRLVSEKIKPRDIDFKLKSSGKIRVGYVSQDYKRHSVAFYITSLINCHDREKFEVYGYSNVTKPDFVTEKLASMFDVYRDISHVGDDEVCDMIVDDKIDILVDLAGLSGGSRILIFAQKPAPIQVTYLGYPDTTGLETMDYRITDRLAEKEDSGAYHTEELVYIDDGFLSYATFGNMPDVGELAAKKNGYITFGSFNNVRKISPYIIGLWSRILLSVKGSKLILKLEGGQEDFVKESYCRIFEENGVSSDRLEIYGYMNDLKHFDLYNEIDIGLDTYPYHGTTTTCEAMWMGVPVVSLVGDHHVSRVGLSLLSRVGLEYFAAKTDQEYIAKAAALAGNVESLSKIRASMRTRVVMSGLCDGPGFAGKVEKAYERMVADRQCLNRSESIKS